MTRHAEESRRRGLEIMGIVVDAFFFFELPDHIGRLLLHVIQHRELDVEVGDEPYYPVNDNQNTRLYENYKKLAESELKVVFGGRLGEYKYYDMDAVVASALELSKKELNLTGRE